MKEQQIKTGEPLFKKRTAVSVEEIMAAGGPTIFGLLSGKNNKNLIRALERTPLEEEAFTEEEWQDMLRQLKENK